jgi:hypothetical protein
LLEINKNYAIGIDELNVTLYKREVSKQGKKYNRPAGYYSTFRNALKALVDAEIKGIGLNNFKTVVYKIDELHKLIELMSPIQKGDSQ